LPYQVTEASVRDGRLRRVLDDYTTPVGGLYTVYPSSRHVSPLVKAFIELTAEQLAATGTSENDKAQPYSTKPSADRLALCLLWGRIVDLR
jgi:hypothetical protein